MRSVLNDRIKYRESFRPFAPVVLRERVHEWFDTPEELDSPYMLLVAGVREARRTDAGDAGLRGLDRLSAARSQVPAVTHVDGSARMQTVDAGRHPRPRRAAP